MSSRGSSTRPTKSLPRSNRTSALIRPDRRTDPRLAGESEDNRPPTLGEIEIEGDTAELAGFKTAVLEAAQRYNLQRARGEGIRRWMFLGVTGAGTRSLAIASLDEADGDDEIKGLIADQRPYACSLVMA